jgi:threonyl-tRNA synthetase
MAVLTLDPKVKLGIDPVIENGFYYDFDFSKPVSEKDLARLEQIMRRLIKQELKFEREEISAAKAKKLFKNQPYKLEILAELTKNKKPKITVYKSGKFIDLCAGPHVDSTIEINPGAFRLTKVAGSHWRGDERNPTLVRIYGVAFDNEKELKSYIQLLKEAEKRDHRKLGKELDLFSFHEEAPGSAFWHPKGMILYNQLENFIREENKRRGYGEVKTPLVLKKEIWKISGHWDKFKENMYFTEVDNEEFAIKPMNCPGGLLIYKEKTRSYKDLPLRFAEFGLVHRHELSGVLHGLFRVRSFVQDDAHSWTTPEGLQKEIVSMVDYAIEIYRVFGFKNPDVFVATRPKKYIGNPRTWEKATRALEESLKFKKISYKIKKGEGAFYGPKIEFNIKDAIGRNWQLGTIQVDFSMPQRFAAFYIDKTGQKQNPVMVHRAILGSLERFIGILIEHYAGALPLWLSPIQTRIIPISEKFENYGRKILEKLQGRGIRAEIDTENETLGKKIRKGEIQKIPYLLIVGEKEAKENLVTVRPRSSKKKNQITTKLEKLIKKLKIEISKKS